MARLTSASMAEALVEILEEARIPAEACGRGTGRETWVSFDTNVTGGDSLVELRIPLGRRQNDSHIASRDF